jgi:hypothetical protein
MIDTLKYRGRLSRLYVKRDKARKDYRKDIAEAKKQKENTEKIEGLLNEAWFTDDEYQDEITSLVTDHLRQKARKLMLPLPNYSDEESWEQSKFSNRYILTEKGIFDLKTKIRNEQKEILQLYLPWLTLIVGVIGALTGLFAVILRK